MFCRERISGTSLQDLLFQTAVYVTLQVFAPRVMFSVLFWSQNSKFVNFTSSHLRTGHEPDHTDRYIYIYLSLRPFSMVFKITTPAVAQPESRFTPGLIALM